MENKTKELIAIGASVAANCIPCLNFHVKKAQEFGASQQELIIASKIGLHVKAGAAEKVETHVSTMLSGFREEKVEDICRCE